MTPTSKTIRKLFALSRNKCAFKDCNNQIVDFNSGTIYGELCHITARNEKGPRYDKNLSENERESFENLMLLCSKHHKEIDSIENIEKYPTETLKSIKHEHESQNNHYENPHLDLSEDLIQKLLKTINETPRVYLDFKGAVLKAGGEGGIFGGNGGDGGVINIFGIAPDNLGSQIDLDGENGKKFGSGGGGGGSIEYHGSPINENEISKGFSVKSFFVANHIELSNGLIYLCGGGWSHMTLQSIPQLIAIPFTAIFEWKKLENPLNITLEIIAESPDGLQTIIPIPNLIVDSLDKPPYRINYFDWIRINIDHFGIWKFHLKSGDIHLFQYDLRFL